MTGTFWQLAAELETARIPFVVVTLARARGHVPQEQGAKAIVTADGLRWGTVGGGKVEARAIEHARALLASEEPETSELLTWNLQRDVGMTCGGEVTYLFEKHGQAAWTVAIFGAGHVSQALSRVLASLDCQITVVDSRAEWIERLPRSPNIQAFVDASPENRISTLGPRCFYVVMTRGHQTDFPILRRILETHPQAPYVGVMGSDVKATKLRAELRESGITESALAKFSCPIGYKVGSNTPEEIAVTIAFQLLQARDAARAMATAGTTATREESRAATL